MPSSTKSVPYQGKPGWPEAEVGGYSALVETLRIQVTYLREKLEIRTEELREHRHLLAGLIGRLPELEASTEPSGATEQLQAPRRSRGGAGEGGAAGLSPLREGFSKAHRGCGGGGCSVAELLKSR